MPTYQYVCPTAHVTTKFIKIIEYAPYFIQCSMCGKSSELMVEYKEQIRERLGKILLPKG